MPGQVARTWPRPSLAYWHLVGAGQEEPGGRLVSRRAQMPREINYNCKAWIGFQNRDQWNLPLRDEPYICWVKADVEQNFQRWAGKQPVQVQTQQSSRGGMLPGDPNLPIQGLDVTEVSPTSRVPWPPSTVVLAARGGCLLTPVPQKENFHSPWKCQPLKIGCYFRFRIRK